MVVVIDFVGIDRCCIKGSENYSYHKCGGGCGCCSFCGCYHSNGGC